MPSLINIKVSLHFFDTAVYCQRQLSNYPTNGQVVMFTTQKEAVHIKMAGDKTLRYITFTDEIAVSQLLYQERGRQIFTE